MTKETYRRYKGNVFTVIISHLAIDARLILANELIFTRSNIRTRSPCWKQLANSRHRGNVIRWHGTWRITRMGEIGGLSVSEPGFAYKFIALSYISPPRALLTFHQAMVNDTIDIPGYIWLFRALVPSQIRSFIVSAQLHHSLPLKSLYNENSVINYIRVAAIS